MTDFMDEQRAVVERKGGTCFEELLAQLACESYGTIYVFLNLFK